MTTVRDENYILGQLEKAEGKTIVVYFKEDLLQRRYNPFLERAVAKIGDGNVRKRVTGIVKTVIERGEWEKVGKYHAVVGELRKYGKEPKLISGGEKPDLDRYYLEFNIMVFLEGNIDSKKVEPRAKKIMQLANDRSPSETYRIVARNVSYHDFDLNQIEDIYIVE